MHLKVHAAPMQDALLALQQALPATAQPPYKHPLVPGVLVVPGTGPAEGLDYSACGEQHAWLIAATLLNSHLSTCHLDCLHHLPCTPAAVAPAAQQGQQHALSTPDCTLRPPPPGQTCCTQPSTWSLPSACSPASKEIIVNRLAGEAVLKGADVFAPGVLACSKGLVPGDLVAVTIAMPGSSPTYTAQTSSMQHDQPGLGQGSATKAKSSRAARAPFVLNRGCTISEQNAHLLPERTHLHLGVGMAMMSRKEMFRASSGLAIAMQQRVFQVPPCNGESAPP